MPEAVLFLCGLTLLVAFICIKGGIKKENTASDYVVLRESLAGTEKILLEDYLPEAVASVAGEGAEKETCKALAVLLRTNAVYVATQEKRKRLSYEEIGLETINSEMLYGEWGEKQKSEYEKIKAAVADTAKEILQYEGISVELPYFPVSAGKTRKGDQLGAAGYPYVKTVDCQEDVFAEGYRQEIMLSAGELKEKLQTIFDTKETVLWKDIVFETDTAGYVQTAAWREKVVSGEYFRMGMEFASACFSAQEHGEGVCIVTKGVGHGFGMSLHTANEMAKNGSDYREILLYFFPDCEITKN